MQLCILDRTSMLYYFGSLSSLHYHRLAVLRNLQCGSHVYPCFLLGHGRTEMTRVHQTKSPVDSELDSVEATRKAKLVFICLNRAQHLLTRNAETEERLKRILYHLCKFQSHPRGTIVVAMPTPFYQHAGHIAGTQRGLSTSSVGFASYGVVPWPSLVVRSFFVGAPSFFWWLQRQGKGTTTRLRPTVHSDLRCAYIFIHAIICRMPTPAWVGSHR